MSEGRAAKIPTGPMPVEVIGGSGRTNRRRATPQAGGKSQRRMVAAGPQGGSDGKKS